METIVTSRLGEVAAVFEQDAISLSARQVAAYSGDVRQALLICSRAAERRRALLQTELAGPSPAKGATASVKVRVAIEDVVGARQELSDSSHMRALRSCTLGEALLLVALGATLRASGREEAHFQSVADKVNLPPHSHSELLHSRNTSLRALWASVGPELEWRGSKPGALHLRA